MDNLPNEHFVEIFKYLNFKELNIISHVNIHWSLLYDEHMKLHAAVLGLLELMESLNYTRRVIDYWFGNGGYMLEFAS